MKQELTKEEILLLYSLVKTAEEGLLPNCYYFGDYCEQYVCINKDNNLWQVYVCERGHKFDSKTFLDCKKACIKVIWECSYTKEEIDRTIGYFLLMFQNSLTLTDEKINAFVNKYGLNVDENKSVKKLVKEID